MGKGPQESRLEQAVTGMGIAEVIVAEKEWHDGANRLRRVAESLREAGPQMQADFGGETGVKAQEAFDKVAGKADQRAEEMSTASAALGETRAAMSRAQEVHRSLGSAPSAPQAPSPAPGGMSDVEDLKRQQAYGRQVDSYNTAMADREAKSKAAADDLDAAFDRSAGAMKKVHGEPDRPAGGGGGGGGGAGGGATGGAGGGGTLPGTVGGPSSGTTTSPDDGTLVVTDDPSEPTGPTEQTTTPDPFVPVAAGAQGGGPVAGTFLPPGDVAGGVSSSGVGGAPTAGGLAGAVGGGLMGGAAGIGGAVRGGAGGFTAVPAGAAAAGGRSIGSSARTAGTTSGALGRTSGAAGATGRTAVAGDGGCSCRKVRHVGRPGGRRCRGWRGQGCRWTRRGRCRWTRRGCGRGRSGREPWLRHARRAWSRCRCRRSGRGPGQGEGQAVLGERRVLRGRAGLDRRRGHRARGDRLRTGHAPTSARVEGTGPGGSMPAVHSGTAVWIGTDSGPTTGPTTGGGWR